MLGRRIARPPITQARSCSSCSTPLAAFDTAIANPFRDEAAGDQPARRFQLASPLPIAANPAMIQEP